MTALVHKIRDSFLDFTLEAELLWSKIFPHREKPAKPVKVDLPKPVPVVAPAPLLNPVPLAPLVNAPPAIVKPAVVAKPATSTKPKLPLSLRLLRFSPKGRLFFFDQLSTLVGSGVTLIDSLSLIRAQTKPKGLKMLYAEMLHHINAGIGLADSMRLFPHIFPKMQVALIEAGEKSGNLKTVLVEIVSEMESQQDFLSKVKGAMFYPAILVFLAITLVTGMMVFVIPRVSTMYEQAKVELPSLTQVVISVSHFIRDQWIILIASIVGGIVLLWLFFSKTKSGKLTWENFVSIIPIFGQIAKEKNLMIIASNMSMLLKSGVLISEAFEITQKAVQNLHYQRALDQIRHDVIMGRPISESMGLKNIEDKKFRENRLFPLAFAQLVHIGETTGTIGPMLMKLRENYHKSIDYKLKNISTVIEPLMIFLVAALVGSILLAVMMPFFYIGTTIK